VLLDGPRDAVLTQLARSRQAAAAQPVATAPQPA